MEGGRVEWNAREKERERKRKGGKKNNLLAFILTVNFLPAQFTWQQSTAIVSINRIKITRSCAPFQWMFSQQLTASDKPLAYS